MSAATDNSLNQCLSSVWQRAQRKHLLGGLLAFTRWFVPLFLVIIVIDRFAYFPGWLRAIAAVTLLGVALRKAWLQGWSQVQAFDATRTAQQVERAVGDMNSLLVTAVQFETSGEAWSRPSCRSGRRRCRPSSSNSCATTPIS